MARDKDVGGKPSGHAHGPAPTVNNMTNEEVQAAIASGQNGFTVIRDLTPWISAELERRVKEQAETITALKNENAELRASDRAKDAVCKEAESKIEALLPKVDQLKKENVANVATIADLRNQIDEKDRLLEEHTKSIESSEDTIKHQKKEAAKMQRKISELSSENKSQKNLNAALTEKAQQHEKVVEQYSARVAFLQEELAAAKNAPAKSTDDVIDLYSDDEHAPTTPDAAQTATASSPTNSAKAHAGEAKSKGSEASPDVSVQSSHVDGSPLSTGGDSPGRCSDRSKSGGRSLFSTEYSGKRKDSTPAADQLALTPYCSSSSDSSGLPFSSGCDGSIPKITASTGQLVQSPLTPCDLNKDLSSMTLAKKRGKSEKVAGASDSEEDSDEASDDSGGYSGEESGSLAY